MSSKAPLGHAHLAGMATAVPPVTATLDDVWEALGKARRRRMPRLHAELIPVMGLRPDVARLPITELGCGGGVAGLARGLDYLRAYPQRNVLLFAVEIPSLTFQPDDHSVDNLVAAMVFADGAGAVVLRGGDGPRGWTLEHAGTVLVPEGARHLGYELRDGGLRVILSRELPDVVAKHLRGAVDGFLAEAGLR